MKQILSGLTAFLFWGILGLTSSCNKANSGRPIPPGFLPGNQLAGIESYLKDSMPKAAFDSLDFSGIITTITDSGIINFVRVPARGVSIGNKFVLIKTDSKYAPLEAACIEITQDSISKTAVPATLGFYGTIRKAYLNGTIQYVSAVNGGYIQALHSINRIAPMEEEDEQEVIELPEIVIYGDDDYYVSFYLMMGGGGGGGGGYTVYSPSLGGGGGSGSSSSSSSYSFSEVNELQAAKPGVDLTQYFNCFDGVNLPVTDATTYSASLLVKVPDPTDPDIMWDPTQADGVGHTFIQLSETNGTNSVTQYLGFYGQGGVAYSTITALGFSVPSKIVDNSGHPYNATLTVNLNAAQFSELQTNMQSYSMAKYNLASYNCTTYALSVFNTVLPTPLNPQSMVIPGQAAGDTPNGLFILLQSMPAKGPDGAVSISNASLTAGSGHGPCN